MVQELTLRYRILFPISPLRTTSTSLVSKIGKMIDFKIFLLGLAIGFVESLAPTRARQQRVTLLHRRPICT